MEQYEWMKFYEAAVLETDCLSLASRIEAAQNTIGQRVITINLEDAERREIVRTLNALSVLKRDAYRNPVCHQCKDAHDPVTPINGRTFIAKTTLGESLVPLHTRCVERWAGNHEFQRSCRLERSLATDNGRVRSLSLHVGRNGMGCYILGCRGGEDQCKKPGGSSRRRVLRCGSTVGKQTV
jgi:hypothetical protein